MMDDMELDFGGDDFADILAKDSRYEAHAYTVLMDVVMYLFRNGHHANGEQILDEFRDRMLDLYGPLAYTLLREWGVHATEDIGEMMFNLAESKRLAKEPEDSAESFVGGYDFKEAFLGPFAV